jgi:hypothetical protein
MERISETKSWFLEKINKIEKPLANMTKQRRERPKSIKSKLKKGTLPQILTKSRGSLENT